MDDDDLDELSHPPTPASTPTATPSPSTRTATATATAPPRQPVAAPTRDPVAHTDGQPDRHAPTHGDLDRQPHIDVTVTPSPTKTFTPSLSPTPTMTPITGQLTWLVNGQQRLNKIFSPPGGFTFVFPDIGARELRSIFWNTRRPVPCTRAGSGAAAAFGPRSDGLRKRIRLIGVFPEEHSMLAVHIADVPALHPGGGTFDVLIDTVIGCQGGQRPTRFRMPAVITYVRPALATATATTRCRSTN